jgi:tetratricopeptide (TPR) repeat protein
VPDWLEARLLLARSLLVAGRTEESLALAAELADETDSAEVRLQYGELLLSAGETEAARSLLDDILADNPGMPEAVRALAFLALTENELDTAREQFETLRGNTDYRNEAFYYLGRIAEEQQDYLQATRSYARVIEGTHAIEAQIRTSMIMLEQMNDAEGALRHLEEFGNANPRFGSEMLLARGRLLLQMGEPERAIALLDDAIAADPDRVDPALADAHVRFYMALAQDASNRGALDEAERWLDEGLDRYPGNVSLRYSYALLLEDQGRDRRAVHVLEDLVEEQPDDPALLNALGYLLTDKFDRHVEARGYIQRALAMNPDSPAIIDSMGWVLFRLGEYRSALDYLERAHRLMDDPVALAEVTAHLVDVHWALGDHEQALDMLREALNEQPDDVHLLEVHQRLMK